MREQLKQVLKNSVYRAIGETANGIGAVNGDDRTLRVLMFHKVNDVPNNRMSMPTGLFDELMAQLKEFGYTVVDLDAVHERAHPRRVLGRGNRPRLAGATGGGTEPLCIGPVGEDAHERVCKLARVVRIDE